MHHTDTRNDNKRSERTCAGCGRADAVDALLRVVLGGPLENHSFEIVVDVAGGAFGRGAHVHPSPDCIAKACKTGFARSFKCKVQVNVAEFSAQIEDAYDRRVTGLVLGARRAGHLAIGQDAACDALAKGAVLAVVACDAGSVAGKEIVSRAAAEGRAVVWKDKAALGKLFGRDEVGIFAVTNAGVGQAIQEARSRSEACRGREER